MNIIIIVVAVTAGVILGGTAIYVYQGKCRQKSTGCAAAMEFTADAYCVHAYVMLLHFGLV